MPPVVKVSACSGILLCAFVFATLGISLMTGPSPGTSVDDAEFDKVALPICLALAIVGIVVSVGLLRAKTWAYRVFVGGLAIVAIPAGLVVLLGTELSLARAVVGILSALAMVLRHILVGERVRTFFGLPLRPRRLLLAPGWLSLGLGVSVLSFLFWPQPTPMFGVWLNPWLERICNVVFGVGYLTLGWGMLRERRWIWPLAILITLGSLLHSAGWSWELNPQQRLGPEEAMSRQSFFMSLVLSLSLSWWTLRRIQLHRSELPPDQTG